MVKKFTVSCNFGASKAPVSFYIGDPHRDYHPIHFQNTWLSTAKGGSVPQEVMDSISKLRDLAIKNNVSFEELCYYAINMANGTVEEENPGYVAIINQME